MATDRLSASPEYKFINPSEFKDTLKNNPLWYLDERIGQLVETYIQKPDDGSANWKETRHELIQMFADALDKDEVALDKDKPEFWNDDDRPHSDIRKRFDLPPLEEGKCIDTVIIHHTAIDEDTTYSQLNALGLLRLYYPLFKNKAFKDKEGNHIPISSGHKDVNGKETFVGYHFLIKQDGSVEKLLDERYVGFHAGNYPENCRSYGVALAGNMSEEVPSTESLAALKGVIAALAPDRILGHGEVTNAKGEKVQTECPGTTFYGEGGWKNELQ